MRKEAGWSRGFRESPLAPENAGRMKIGRTGGGGENMLMEGESSEGGRKPTISTWAQISLSQVGKKRVNRGKGKIETGGGT